MATEENISFIVDDPGKIHDVVEGKIKLPPVLPARNRLQAERSGDDAADTAGPPLDPPVGRTMWDLVKLIDVDEDPNELLKHRYLCRGGGLLLVGSTGIGKSTFAMQCAALWGLGVPAFGIEPNGVLRSLIIQAENDDADEVEMISGIADGLRFEDSLLRTAGENIIIVREDARTSERFFTETVQPMLEQFKPDLLFIDPALGYLGGEAMAQAEVTKFLRNGLNPLLRQYNCGAVVLHHTVKPSRQNNGGSAWTHADYAYSGFGSVEWANWPRAVLVIHGTEQPSIFELKATKRGARIGWKDATTNATITTRHIAHSNIDGQLFWREPDAAEIPAGKSDEDLVALIMDLVPDEGTIEKKVLIEECQKNHKSKTAVERAITRLITRKSLFLHELKRPSVRAAKHLAREPQTLGAAETMTTTSKIP
jgi:hypothetical protein